MKTAIDRFGRVLIPKSLRDRMGLTAGSEVELSEDHGKVTIEPAEVGHVMTREESGLIVLHAEVADPIDPVARSRGERLRSVTSEDSR